MRKCTKIILAVILTLAVLLVIAWMCFSNWFYSPGIHIFAKFAHLETTQVCYVFNADTEEYLGKSVFTVDGDVNGWKEKDNGVFYGYMNVEGYPIPFYQAYELSANEGHIALFEGKELILSYWGQDWYVDDNGAFHLGNLSDYTYVVSMNVDNPIHILIRGKTGKESGAVPFVAICAEDLETATQLLTQITIT